MAKYKKGFPQINLKVLLTALVIVILPAVVVAAASSKLYQTNSGAFYDSGGYGGTNPSNAPSKAPQKLNLWITNYSINGRIAFEWDSLRGARSYSLVEAYGENAPLRSYYNVANTTSTKFSDNSSRIFTRGKGSYWFQIIAFMANGDKISSNLASIIRK